MVDRECDFTLQHYADVLGAWVEAGVRFQGFAEPLDATSPSVILRHDVDFDPPSVVPVAELEHRLGVKSTFFFRVRAEQYNLFSPSGMGAMDRAVTLGHGVGLHFDASSTPDGAEALLAEARSLEALSGITPRAFSVHRPAPSALGWEVDGLINTYEERFMLPRTRYLSDSNMHWRDGCICQHRDSSGWGESQTLHLLTHAEWWTGAAGDVTDLVRAYLARRAGILEEEMAREIRGYGGHRRRTGSRRVHG